MSHDRPEPATILSTEQQKGPTGGSVGPGEDAPVNDTSPRTKRTIQPKTLSLADLDRLVLKSGGHERRRLDALCVMEAVAWMAGREHSDHPPCVSTVIGAFLRSWNDALNDDDRQMLKPLIPRVIGTAATPEIELQRSWMALDWYCRVSAPAWLRLAGLTSEAEAIEATSAIVDPASAEAAQDALHKSREAAQAARAAAWAAARAAAGAAARAAAGDAARAAAWAAAWDAARAAAGAAAWDAARAAARAAAWAKLRPTVEILQQSAIGLIDRMIALSVADAVA